MEKTITGGHSSMIEGGKEILQLLKAMKVFSTIKMGRIHRRQGGYPRFVLKVDRFTSRITITFYGNNGIQDFWLYPTNIKEKEKILKKLKKELEERFSYPVSIKYERRSDLLPKPEAQKPIELTPLQYRIYNLLLSSRDKSGIVKKVFALIKRNLGYSISNTSWQKFEELGLVEKLGPGSFRIIEKPVVKKERRVRFSIDDDLLLAIGEEINQKGPLLTAANLREIISLFLTNRSIPPNLYRIRTIIKKLLELELIYKDDKRGCYRTSKEKIPSAKEKLLKIKLGLEKELAKLEKEKKDIEKKLEMINYLLNSPPLLLEILKEVF